MVSELEAENIIGELEKSYESGREFRDYAVEILSQLSHFNWTGIYRLEGEELVLDAYVGAETNHTRIPVGRGVCGTAVAENANQVVSDVRSLENYLACSIDTRSEIVVLIRKGNKVLGQIDIDGHEVAAFDATDEALLTQVAAMIAAKWD